MNRRKVRLPSQFVVRPLRSVSAEVHDADALDGGKGLLQVPERHQDQLSSHARWGALVVALCLIGAGVTLLVAFFLSAAGR